MYKNWSSVLLILRTLFWSSQLSSLWTSDHPNPPSRGEIYLFPSPLLGRGSADGVWGRPSPRILFLICLIWGSNFLPIEIHRVPKSSIFIVLGILFGIDFHDVSQLLENSCFATCIMWNPCFWFSRPPIMASKIHPKIMSFQDAFLDTLFDDFMVILCENDHFLDPS